MQSSEKTIYNSLLIIFHKRIVGIFLIQACFSHFPVYVYLLKTKLS